MRISCPSTPPVGLASVRFPPSVTRNRFPSAAFTRIVAASVRATAAGSTAPENCPPVSGMYPRKLAPDDTGIRFDISCEAPPENGRKNENAAGAPVIPENDTPHVHPAGSGPALSVASSDTEGTPPGRNEHGTGCCPTISTPASVSTADGVKLAVPEIG